MSVARKLHDGAFNLYIFVVCEAGDEHSLETKKLDRHKGKTTNHVFVDRVTQPVLPPNIWTKSIMVPLEQAKGKLLCY